jgi:hypothetical protein
MAGTKPRQPSQPRNKCPEVQNELPRSGKPDNSDLETTSAAGQSEIRIVRQNLNWIAKSRRNLEVQLLVNPILRRVRLRARVILDPS